MRYFCGNCETRYQPHQYDKLEKVPIDPDESDPMQGKGYERVCGECGSTFHTEQWRLRDAVDTDNGEVTVSTVSLLIPHGPQHEYWFETCLFHESGSRVVDRYVSKQEAKEGHADKVERLEAGRYRMVPTGSRLELDTL